MQYSVFKRYSFDAAHRLANGYVGKCANIHGHTWTVEFELVGSGLNKQGMLFDFGDFKPLKTWIDENLDHAIMICKEDSDVTEFVAKKGWKHFEFNENPTSEYLAHYLLQLGRNVFNIPLKSVTVQETCTAEAKCSD